MRDKPFGLSRIVVSLLIKLQSVYRALSCLCLYNLSIAHLDDAVRKVSDL